MVNIAVLGGTGYVGGNIVAAAVRRGHSVTAYSRHAAPQPLAGATYVQASVLDDDVLVAAFDGADAVICALAPRGELEGRLLGVVERLESLSASRGIRLGVMGGAGSLLVTPAGPKLSDTDGFPDEFKAEAAEMEAVLTSLREHSSASDWFYVSPAASFGPWAPGEATGSYRIGGDVLLTDSSGESNLSGADLGDAFIAEIETPAHHRQRFSVAS
jgi:putative NADH-flavin reductase